jgi:hypothetical protein
MATKKRAKTASRSPDDKARPGSATDVERTSNAEADSDVERSDGKPRSTSLDPDVESTENNPAPAPGNVEALDPATPRVDIEHDDGSDSGDVERGPP